MIDKKFMKAYNEGRAFERKRIIKIIRKWDKRIQLHNKSRGVYGSGRYVFVITRVCNWRIYINELISELKTQQEKK